MTVSSRDLMEGAYERGANDALLAVKREVIHNRTLRPVEQNALLRAVRVAQLELTEGTRR